MRVLVGVRRHGRPARRGAECCERLGAHPDAFDAIGVLAATAPTARRWRTRSGATRRVAYVERDAKLQSPPTRSTRSTRPPGSSTRGSTTTVHAADALLAAGGGSRRTIAVMDTGLDIDHPEFAGRIARTYDTVSKGSDVTDTVGHGTFVTGLIAAIDGNGIGGKGVAGNTKVLAIRASRDGDFTTRDLLRGIVSRSRATPTCST